MSYGADEEMKGSALIGAAQLGILGALLAVPVAASIQVIGRQVILPRLEAA